MEDLLPSPEKAEEDIFLATETLRESTNTALEAAKRWLNRDVVK